MTILSILIGWLDLNSVYTSFPKNIFQMHIIIRRNNSLFPFFDKNTNTDLTILDQRDTLNHILLANSCSDHWLNLTSILD